MHYRPFGHTGVQVSPLCLGTMNFAARTTKDEAFAIIDAAIAAGINFLDTANVYGRGASEEVTGEALKRNGKRDWVVLATKVHAKMDDNDPNGMGNSRRHIMMQCDASLRRLKTDWIDLYQIHRPQPKVAIDETLKALDDLIRAGKVRYIGTSVFAAWHVVQAQWIAKELGTNRFVCEQPPYSILDRRIELELLPAARTYGMAVIPYSPLAAGMLSGKYKIDQEPAADSRYAGGGKQPGAAKRYNDHILETTAKLGAFAKQKERPLSQIALSWCMNQPDITSPIIGPRTMEQFKDNLAAMDVTLTKEDHAAIDAIVPPGGVVSPYYDPDAGATPLRW